MLFSNEFEAVCHACTSSEAVLYAALVTLRNARTMATPPVGVALLMEKTNMPRRTVFRCISRLIELRLIEKDKQGSRSIYRFPFMDEKVPPMARNDAISDTQHRQTNSRGGD